ncbi:unnamed protein product, partial [Allacma fusca]
MPDSSDTNLSNEDQELDQTIPTLISEIFLEELRDVKLLKTCRLVCKSWNIAASFLVEMIRRRDLILDFKKFKQIELNWNSSLTAPLFRDFVGHLEKI